MRSPSSNNFIAFMCLLALASTGLKVNGVLDWSWGWVLAPVWFPLALGFCATFLISISK
ncbi:hypothetical protein ACFL0Q_08725 [Thermodesulfobacteriota bacterium]